MYALFLGLRAGLKTDEVAKLRAEVFRETGREGGKKSGAVRKANRPWASHAMELARGADASASNEKIACAISDRWKRADVDCPGIRTLAEFVSELRASGRLPQRTPSLRK